MEPRERPALPFRLIAGRIWQAERSRRNFRTTSRPHLIRSEPPPPRIRIDLKSSRYWGPLRLSGAVFLLRPHPHRSRRLAMRAGIARRAARRRRRNGDDRAAGETGASNGSRRGAKLPHAPDFDSERPEPDGGASSPDGARRAQVRRNIAPGVRDKLCAIFCGYDPAWIEVRGAPEAIVAEILELRPLVVGFSLIFQFFLPQYRKLAQRVTSHFTIGGHSPGPDRHTNVLNKRSLSQCRNIDSRRQATGSTYRKSDSDRPSTG